RAGRVERGWRERATRSIFYPPPRVAPLGWPADQDRLSASRTRFQDLLRLPRRRVSLSTFTLEEDAIVSLSPLLEDLDAAGLPVERLVARPAFADAAAGRPAAVWPFLPGTLMRHAAPAPIGGGAGGGRSPPLPPALRPPPGPPTSRPR